MSATKRSDIRLPRRALYLLLVSLPVFGQTASPVTERDIERARRMQPVITERDIERARSAQPVITDKDIERAIKGNPMPSDQELRKAAAPIPPRIDKLPQPLTPRTVDLGALAKGYDDATQAAVAAQGGGAGPKLLVFVSFSVPEAALQQLADQAAKSQATLLLRGFDAGSLLKTVERVNRLIGARKVGIAVDPQAFERFAVTTVPTFVLLRTGVQGQQCGSGTCYSPDSYATTAGDVSIDYALEHIERTSPRFAKDARHFLKKIRR